MEGMDHLRFFGHSAFVLRQKLPCVLQSTLIELMLCEISHSNRANLSQSELREMFCIIYGACKLEKHTYLCF